MQLLQHLLVENATPGYPAKCIEAAKILLTALTVLISASGFAQSNSTPWLPAINAILLEDEAEALNASAGPDQITFVGEIVQLDGSASSDPDELPLTYLWSIVSAPAGSASTLSSNSLVNPELFIDVPGTYVVQLIVNNGSTDSAPDSMVISTQNRAPSADAGMDISAVPNQLLMLDGSASFDADGDPLSYAWSISSAPAASSAVLSDPSIEMPTFTPVAKGSYVIELVVNDGLTDSTADSLQIEVGIELSLEVSDTFFGIGRESTATITLDQPAPTIGATLDVSIDDAFAELSTTTLNFAAGETSQMFTLTGIANGITMLRVSGTDIDEVSQQIEVSGALVSVGNVEVIAPSENTSVPISISDPAPIGGVNVSLEIVDPGIASLSQASVFIPEGAFAPMTNAQVTGLSLGETMLRATAPGFAPDEREVLVALSASFDPATLVVPEFQSRTINLSLDAPAPSGGLTFDLSLVKNDAGDPDIFSIPAQITVNEGETLSDDIIVNGLTEGSAILRATAENFVDTDADITVTDAPNAFLISAGSASPLAEGVVGLQLQTTFRIRLETTPIAPVDIKLSIPPAAGVLLSMAADQVGAEELLFEDLTAIQTNAFYVQGTALGDDVPLMIEVFDANTTTATGYESLAATFDVDPAGVFVNTSPITTTTFATNRTVQVTSALLYDNESPGMEGEHRTSQQVRAGVDLVVPMQVDNTAVATLPDGGTGDLTIAATDSSGTISVDPGAAGSANISIVEQPEPGFALPADRTDTVSITVNTPDAFLRSLGSASHLSEAIVGIDLQTGLRIGFETAPPVAVDVMVSVPMASGVLLSTDANSAGASQILLEDVTGTRSDVFYAQGLSIGDDVPVSIEIYAANTLDPVVYNILHSTVDVDPSGVYVNSSDYSTTTFSAARNIAVTSAVLFDNESPSQEGLRRTGQTVRGGLNLDVSMQSDDAMVAALPGGSTDTLTIAGGDSQGLIAVTPVGGGVANISITAQPANFSLPLGFSDSVTATVTAPDAFLRSLGSASYLSEAVVGIDLQAAYRVRLQSTPPSARDIEVSVPLLSGVLLSTDSMTAGTTSLLFEDIAGIETPTFYIQGTALGDDVPLTISVVEANTSVPGGYNVLASTIDIDPSGIYLSTSDFETTTFSANTNLTLNSVLLYDDEHAQDGQRRTTQTVRGGLDIDIDVEVDEPTVAALPSGAADTATMTTGTSSTLIAIDPLTAGVATVSISDQPRPGFALPSDRDDRVVITVDAPETRFNVSSLLIGDELQQGVNVTLEAAPPAPVDVTVEVIAPSVAVISDDATMMGTGTVVFSNVSSTNVGEVFVQGLDLGAATQLKVSAPGYQDRSIDLDVVKSGFRLSGSDANINAGQSRSFNVISVRLNENNTVSTNQAVRGGSLFDVTVTSSQPTVGTIASPITLSNGDGIEPTIFNALSPGMTEIRVTQPAGFTEPAGAADIDLTVE